MVTYLGVVDLLQRRRQGGRQGGRQGEREGWTDHAGIGCVVRFAIIKSQFGEFCGWSNTSILYQYRPV